MRELDAFLPEYEFVERHEIRVSAPAESIDAAFRQVRLRDSRLVRVLYALRGLHGAEGSILSSVPGAIVLEDAPGEGIVLGLTGQFWKAHGGGTPRARTADEWLAYTRLDGCKAVIDFRVGPSVLTTETRVHVPGAAARRSFGRYWRVIRPFSGLIRILWLRAGKRRAEEMRAHAAGVR